MDGNVVGVGGGSVRERKNEALSYSSLAGAIFLAVPGFSKNARGKVKADGAKMTLFQFFSMLLQNAKR